MTERDTTTVPVPGRRWVGPVLETVVAFGAAALFVAFCLHIRVDPLDRMGQVSGLASLQVRFVLFVAPLIAALIIAAKLRGAAHFAMTSRLVCAALAGFATAFVAGGIVVALRGTPWCLNAKAGDMDMMIMWANAIEKKFSIEYPPPFYPPGFPHFLSWYMGAVDQPGFYAMKHLQIAGTAMFGPVAYLSWRMLLRPGWALGIGVIAAFVVIEPYKPHANLVLVALIPLLVKFLQLLRRAHERSPRELARAGVLCGLAFGALFLFYSGWFRWSAPGVVVAAAVMMPWKSGKARAALFGAITLAVFLVVTWSYLKDINSYRAAVATNNAGPMIQDTYVFFDVAVDPAYVAMWKGDLPGMTPIWDWPPAGELGGVGVYTLLLYAGLGIAVAFARQRTVVITTGLVFAGVWLSRFWEAQALWATKLVQLYPRTSIQLAHMLVVIAGFGVYYIVEFASRRLDPSDAPRSPSRLIGAVCGLALLFGTMASAVSDRYMPIDQFPRGTGWLAFLAHQTYRDKVSPYPAPTAPAPTTPPPVAP